MKITLLQHDIPWKGGAAWLPRLEELMPGLGETDLVVLPEMFATGFCMDSADIAEPENGAVWQWMRRVADSRGYAVAGSVAVACVDGGYRNRFYFVRPGGQTDCYDKRHLFTYGSEQRSYEPGNGRTVVEYRGARILLQVCYDLRFPVWSRNDGDCPYDVALYVASWPESRIAVWDLLLRARAVENQCYVAGVNRVGSDPLCQYTGHSVLVDAYGKVVTDCGNAETAVTAELDLERLHAFRKKFPVLADADKFRIDD